MADNTYLDELQLQNLKAQYEAQNASAVASKIQEMVDCVNALKIQVGFLGERGTGVTTLVQAIVKKPRPVSDPWAYFREAPQPTKQAVVHIHPAYPNLTLHDLPGFGGSEKPATYLKGLGDLSKYGCFVVVVGCEGLRDTHLQVLKAIKQTGRPFLLARTKIDLDLHTAKRRLRTRFNPAEQLGLVRKGLADTLAKDKTDPKKLFLVSGLEPERYEFARFEDSLEGEVLTLKRNHDGNLDDLTSVSEKKIKELYKICESRSLSEIPSVIHSVLENPTEIRLNVAVIGEAGSGRSSLINALRGLGSKEEDAAPTGLTQTTKEAMAYQLSTVPCLYLWDLPGVGVTEEDVSRMDLSRYDFFLLVASERYKHVHSCLARAIYSTGKQMFFVRNKIDVDVEARPGSQSFTKDERQERVRKSCMEALKKDGVDAPQVFLVSCHMRDTYDLASLQEALKNSAPELKRKALKRAIPTVISRLVRRKAKMLMKDAWGKALQICLSFAENPRPDEAENVAVTIGIFCVDFGLDDASLERTAQVVDKAVPLLRAEIQSVFTKPLNSEYVYSLITKPVSLITWVQGYVPYWGRNVNVEPKISFESIYGLLKQVVVELSDDAERVLLRAYMED
nr:interferon-inducible GTPase 5-like [Pogona vitticeps]